MKIVEHRSRINQKLFVPDSSPFQISWEGIKVSGQSFVQRMSLCPNVIEQGSMNLNELAD